MAYFPPYIDSAGLHIPVYEDIYNYELQQFLSVYGQAVNTGNDSADIQWISIFSLMIADAFNTAQLVYNARSPQTAIGSDLDAICKVNGIYRKPATSSVVVLTVSGVAGTIISNGVAQDISGFLWDLPATVVIPNSGSINVTSICETPGAISAQRNTIVIVSNPTAGWNSVSNAAAATLGQPQESDSQLRARQAVSVGITSKTLVSSTIAAIAALPNVTRWNPGVATPGGPGTSVENPTGATDSWGNPAHSISMVVEGGANLDVATAIYNNKTPGCLTNGTTTVAVIDPNTLATMDISFFRPSYVPIYVNLTIHALANYSSAVIALIKTAIVNYLNSLQIGEELTISALYGAALAVMPNLSQPQFSITSLQASSPVVNTTATETNGSNVIVVANATGIVVGQFVSDGGVNIPVNTTVTSISGTSITLSKGLTGAGSTVPVSFFVTGTVDVSVNFNQVVNGVASNVNITVS